MLAYCRLDAQKFVCETRRAVAERAENIGIWFKILEMLAKLAVISNVSIQYSAVQYSTVHQHEYTQQGVREKDRVFESLNFFQKA